MSEQTAGWYRERLMVIESDRDQWRDRALSAEAALAARPDPCVKGLVEACEGLIQSLDSVSDAETFESVKVARKARAAAKSEPAEKEKN